MRNSCTQESEGQFHLWGFLVKCCYFCIRSSGLGRAPEEIIRLSEVRILPNAQTRVSQVEKQRVAPLYGGSIPSLSKLAEVAQLVEQRSYDLGWRFNSFLLHNAPVTQYGRVVDLMSRNVVGSNPTGRSMGN